MKANNHMGGMCILRTVVRVTVVGALLTSSLSLAADVVPRKKPNVIFLLADQWRADALGYAGDPNVKTRHLDRLAAKSVNFTHAVSGCPVCCPYRATLMTGQRPLTHGVFLNDVSLPREAVTVAEILTDAGYDTGYIGKWHLDGQGRSAFIPVERRQGFTYWRALECTHNYNNSFFYADGSMKLKWDGYDAIAQTRDARQYIRRRAKSLSPFVLFLSFGGPHNPYHTAPEEYRAMYRPEEMQLRPNVPVEFHEAARKDLAGYYAHCTAIDDCIGEIINTLRYNNIEDDTLIVFTSDHGDMLYSQGQQRKQKPWDESIRVPLLVHYPRVLGKKGRKVDVPVNSEDILPTLLGLCRVPIPDSVEGLDYSGFLNGAESPSDGAALITCPSPFGEWDRSRGGREYRGLRTSRYTYVRDLGGPWLMYDNQVDPYQLENLVGKAEFADLQAELDQRLQHKLDATGDEFLPGSAYITRWGYTVDRTGTVPYTQ